MRKSNREINVFSMSALDLFASALGAFILIAIVLFPFFPNVGDSPERVAELLAELRETKQQLETCQSDLTQTRADLQQTRADLQQTQADLQQTQADLQQTESDLREAQRQAQQAQESLEQCRQELRKKFLLVLISWSSRDDIDLHVTDPQGNEFYYNAKTHSGSRAKLEEDNTTGPGNEIWLHPEAEPGQYRVHYNLYDKESESSSVEVRGAILTPEGREEFPNHTLRREREKRLIATITVSAAGIATLRTH